HEFDPCGLDRARSRVRGKVLAHCVHHLATPGVDVGHETEPVRCLPAVWSIKDVDETGLRHHHPCDLVRSADAYDDAVKSLRVHPVSPLVRFPFPLSLSFSLSLSLSLSYNL